MSELATANEEEAKTNSHVLIGKKEVQDYFIGGSIACMPKSAFIMGKSGISIHKNTYTIKGPSHRHDFFEIQYIEKGESEQIINGETVILKERTLTFFNKNTEHTILKTTKETRLFHIVIDENNFTDFSFKNMFVGDSFLTNYIFNSLKDIDGDKGYFLLQDLDDSVKDIINIM